MARDADVINIMKRELFNLLLNGSFFDIVEISFYHGGMVCKN